MKRCLLLAVLIAGLQLHAQRNQNSDDSTGMRQQVDAINRLLDRAVVKKQPAILQRHYADDFVFTHSTGQVDSKSSWIKSVMDTATHYLSREHDSVVVELHHHIAVVAGTLTVRKSPPVTNNSYALRYIRVYVYRRPYWQLVSHRSTAEWSLKE